MANTATEQISLVRLGEHIRKLWHRLTPLEDATSQSKSEIKHLKQEAEEVQASIETIKEMVNSQDAETADHDRRITELQKKLSAIETKVATHEATIQNMSKKIHGEKVKRGLALSRAERAEKKITALSKRSRKTKD